MSIVIRRLALAIAALLFTSGLVAVASGSATAYSPGCSSEDAAVSAAQAKYAKDYKPAKRLYKKLVKAQKRYKHHHTAANKKALKKLKKRFTKAARKVNKEYKTYAAKYGEAYNCHHQGSGTTYVGPGGSGPGTASNGTPLDQLFAQCAATPAAPLCAPLQSVATQLMAQCQSALGTTPLGLLCAGGLPGGLPGGAGLPTDPSQLIAQCAATPLAPLCTALGGLLTGLPAGGLPTDPTQVPGLVTGLLESLLGGLPGLPTSGLPTGGLPTGSLPTGTLPTSLPTGDLTGILTTVVGGLGL